MGIDFMLDPLPDEAAGLAQASALSSPMVVTPNSNVLNQNVFNKSVVNNNVRKTAC